MKPLPLTAVLMAALQGQQPNDLGQLTLTPETAVAAVQEFNTWRAAQPDSISPPSLPIWTTVQVIDGEHAGVVGVVCGGSGDSIEVNPGDGKPIVTVPAASLNKLA